MVNHCLMYNCAFIDLESMTSFEIRLSVSVICDEMKDSENDFSNFSTKHHFELVFIYQSAKLNYTKLHGKTKHTNTRFTSGSISSVD